MKVSFDLDDTLFVSQDEFKTEAVPFFTYKWKYKERLRKGTIELFEIVFFVGLCYNVSKCFSAPSGDSFFMREKGDKHYDF